MRFLKSFLLLLLFTASLFSQSNEYTLQEGTTVKLIDGEAAKSLIMTEDMYTAVFSKFDIQSKPQKTGAVSVNDYLNYAASQVTSWSEDDKKEMKKIVESVGKKITLLGLKLKMPAEIQVIKTSMNEEGGADGYTRAHIFALAQKK